MKVLYIFMTIGCLLIETFAYDNLQCRKIDFNNINSIYAIEKCSGFNEFTIKSFDENSAVLPYSYDSVYYLSNIDEGWSCFVTTDYFTLEEDVEIYTAIYLQSMVVEDMSEVEIDIIDLDRGSIISVVNATATRDSEWNSYGMKFGRRIANAMVHLSLPVNSFH